MVGPDAVVQRINENEGRGAWLPVVAVLLGLVGLWNFGLAGGLAGSLLAAAGFWGRNYLAAASLVELEYDLTGEDRRRFESIQRAVQELSRCSRMWRVDAFGETDDWKRNAGAGRLVRRSAMRAGTGCGRSFRANLTIPHLMAASETIYFLPDMILVRQAGRYGAVAYGDVQVGSTVTEFREGEGVPPDSEVVGYTWRYVNKNGGPDRRFSNNHQIPLVHYGQAALLSDSGLRLAWMTSSVGAARIAAEAIDEMRMHGGGPVSYRVAGV